MPVVCFDAVLPGQHLVGRTDDPTFCRFLQHLGLGGFFVMTSLQPKMKMIRRHGVVCKILAVDARQATSNDDRDGSDSDYVPTAVDFEIVGHSRCRVVGPTIAHMKQRIGRWRRVYDPNGEESCLGWGDERFIDVPAELESTALAMENPPQTTNDANLSDSEWSSCWVEIHLDWADMKIESDRNDSVRHATKVQHLRRLVYQWSDLASNPSTFENLDVTALTRIRKGQPGLWVDPSVLLKRVKRQLGENPPDDPTAFALWAAALINPLPALGISMEIRGAILEAPTAERRLNVLEMGLVRSIDNLTGKRPL